MADTQQIIEEAFENRANISPENASDAVRDAVQSALDMLDSGAARM